MAGPRTPPWPSLYNPTPELQHRHDSDPTPPGAHYLYNANDIFRFTLYWTLIFTLPPFIICGVWASITTMSAPPTRQLSVGTMRQSRDTSPSSRQKPQARLIMGIAVFLTFVISSLGVGVVSSVVVGYGLAGFYSAGSLNMSTWVPFAWGLIQSLVGLIGLWPAVTNLI
ncbi:hypothetical protein SISNIDRAFT_549102 [Sistotremastrum niveocremeum HHB9708]|uniref:Integral membrane protein n=1 Tax=Sistotremastrum niveocremeum HHB9708 TaxID=1314777 RepID=A0A164VXB0_9AGAM|nr:hypothetical protein SISNIDRAFT_549102 [Sistotremastrum niveocremeum HHB9708]